MNWNGRRVTAAIVLTVLLGMIILNVGISIGRGQNPAPIINNTYNNTTVGSPTVPNNAAITPVNEAQRVMLEQFRLATSAEAAVLQNVPDFMSDPAFQHIYVATKPDITLVPIATSMVLVLANGHKWVAGPSSMITILRVPTVTIDGLHKYAVPFMDPLCDLQRFDVLKGNCMDAFVQSPATWAEMVRNTRQPTRAELSMWLGSDGDGADPKHYRVAIRDLRIAPEYRFDGFEDYDGIVAVFVPKGVKVLGGQLGYMDVIPVGDAQYTEIAMDTLCFMHNHPVAVVNPANFAPATETKRVERCTRR